MNLMSRMSASTLEPSHLKKQATRLLQQVNETEEVGSLRQGAAWA